MNVDYENLDRDLENGTFRQQLEEELLVGFRQIRLAGERLPTASHYAAQIAMIVNGGGTVADNSKYYVYQEILAACEAARATVLGEDLKPA
jgi:hypothetical protein